MADATVALVVQGEYRRIPALPAAGEGIAPLFLQRVRRSGQHGRPMGGHWPKPTLRFRFVDSALTLARTAKLF